MNHSTSDENARLRIPVDRIFTDLEARGDIAFTESKAYVVGYVCRELKGGLRVDRQLKVSGAGKAPKKPKRYYDDEMVKLQLMVDIAVEACAYGYQPSIDERRGVLNEFRHRVLHVPPENRNLRSVNALKRELLKYHEDLYTEGDTMFFWKKMHDEGMGDERRDYIARALKRGRIISRDEHDRIWQMYYKEEWIKGLLTDVQQRKVERMLEAYY